MLLNQIQVIGGNKTGVFVHHVTEGSSAHNTGIIPGSQILQVRISEFLLGNIWEFQILQNLFNLKAKPLVSL